MGSVGSVSQLMAPQLERCAWSAQADGLLRFLTFINGKLPAFLLLLPPQGGCQTATLLRG